MAYRQYIISFGKKIGLLEVLFGNGFIDIMKLAEKIITDLQNKPAEERLSKLYGHSNE